MICRRGLASNDHLFLQIKTHVMKTNRRVIEGILTLVSVLFTIFVLTFNLLDAFNVFPDFVRYVISSDFSARVFLFMITELATAYVFGYCLGHVFSQKTTTAKFAIGLACVLSSFISFFFLRICLFSDGPNNTAQHTLFIICYLLSYIVSAYFMSYSTKPHRKKEGEVTEERNFFTGIIHQLDRYEHDGGVLLLLFGCYIMFYASCHAYLIL